MAQIDASGLTFSFSAFLPSSVSFNPGTATPFSYSWQSDDLLRITALSYSADITAGLAGTVDAVNILGSTFEPGLSISGIDVQLTSLIDAGNDTLNHEKFWDTLLAGETTLYLPDQGSQLDIMGDFVRVATGQTRTGGADTFIGGYPFSPSGNLSGDAIRVDAGGTLHGGADRFVDTLLSGLLVGDVGSPSGFADSVGTVYGGDDVFTLQDRQFSPSSYIGQIVGDVRQTADGSVTHGGNDTVTLTNLGGFSDVIGDVQYSNGNLFGGDDVILIATTLLGRNFTSGNYVTGDAQTASLNGATVLTATGGDDAITLNNVGASALSGDFYTVSNFNAIGGDDTITLAGTFPQPGPADVGYQYTPSVYQIVGDAAEVTAGVVISGFEGGDDRISVTNAYVTQIFGDVSTFGLVGSGQFFGGDDVIDVAFNHANNSFGAAIFGDASGGSLNSNASFGDDRITVDLRGSAGTSLTLRGDVESVTTSGASPLVVTFGDDLIRFSGSYNQSVTMYGDASFYDNSANDLTFYWGDDTLIGGQGNDQLVGDGGGGTGTPAAIEYFGNDVLDGGGGNDSLIGGNGSDTASFASLNQAVVVFLGGIPGSDPGNPIHAIGQGNDHFESIENVIGSSRNDVIIGNADNNTIEGGRGADLLNGDTGLNTLSYASSEGYVNVSLQTSFAGGGAGSHAIGDKIANFVNLIGSAHTDILSADGADNLISGLGGDDTLRGRGGADTLDGGDGSDTASYSDSSAFVNVSLLTGSTAGGGAGNHAFGDTFFSIENLQGSAFSDTLSGDDSANILEGRAGADTLNGNNGSDTASYGDSNASVNVSLLTGYTAGGHALGDLFNSIENLIGSAYNDILNGNNNDNVLEGGLGGDTLNGGGSSDTVSYAASTAFVNISLLTGFASGGSGNHAAGDTFNSIENLIGSGHNDIMNGNNDPNIMEGGAGADALNGVSGIDTLSYASSAAFVNVSLASGFTSGGVGNHATGDVITSFENLIGSAYDDILSGSSSVNNVLSGGLGNDKLLGRGGADTMNGDDGSDTASYLDSISFVNVSLLTGFTGGGSGNHATGDTFNSIENLEGSAFNDILNGNNASNVMSGLAGSDALRGYGAADTFVFNANFGNDTVLDFQDGSDLLDFRGNAQVAGIADLLVTTVGADALVSDDHGNTITLVGVAGMVSGADFLF